MSKQVAAVVLAAGLSERFGETDKLLADAGGTTIIRKVAATVRAANVADIVAVTSAKPVEDALAEMDIRFVRNAVPTAGMGTSLACGANAVSETNDGLLVVLGDMPKLQTSTIDKLIRTFEKSAGKDIVVPVHDGRRGHPVLFGKKYLTQLRALSGDIGARDILRKYPTRVLAVTVDDPGVLFDVDSPDDLGR